MNELRGAVVQDEEFHTAMCVHPTPRNSSDSPFNLSCCTRWDAPGDACTRVPATYLEDPDCSIATVSCFLARFQPLLIHQVGSPATVLLHSHFSSSWFP